MARVFEKKGFQWGVIAGSFLILLAIVATFFVKAHLQNLAREKAAEERLQAERDYEDNFRSVMMRIYQNLKLEHYLAAYKNLEDLPEPKKSDVLKVDEYLDILNRVGNGLIRSQLLKESENVFLTIRNYEGQVSNANEALGKIESKRRIENAKIFFEQGERLFAQKRYREAYSEFEKTQLELHSVEILHFDDVKDLSAKVMAPFLEAKFYMLLEDSNAQIKHAEQLLTDKKYKKADAAISQAAITVGRAAHLNRESAEVAKLRARISDLDSELAYRLPNEVPIWNSFSVEDQGKKPNYFRLVGYELSPIFDEEHRVKISLQYLMNPAHPFFVIRYRIFFFNGRDVFNGHFLMPEGRIPEDQPQSIVYLQEVPEKLQGAQIKRIEVKVFDSKDQIVSRVTRAFRGARS